jgi:hypothetical protein
MIKLVNSLALLSALVMVSATSVAEYKVNLTSQFLNDKANFSYTVPVLVPFDEAGIYGNITLIGSNGITTSSIKSNAV